MFRFAVADRSHVGSVRGVNEDDLYVDRDRRIWAVADGMGGHARGDWASAQVVRALEEMSLGQDVDANCESIADAMNDANSLIFEAGCERDETIGSTVVIFHAPGPRFACLWSGDSRAYHFRGGSLRQISRDHSQVEEMVAAGLIGREESRNHALANVITRAVGASGQLALDMVSGDLADNDRFLLCSDGLTRCVEDHEIATAIAAHPPEAAADFLLDLCLGRGAPDNISLIIIACEHMTQAFQALQRHPASGRDHE